VLAHGVADRRVRSADGAYDRGKLMSKAAYHDFVLEVARKLVGQQGFQPGDEHAVELAALHKPRAGG
jgi:hypothetical protein